jgi:SpoVK/Ycf46/Vps4 family AAA+-type ATPase
MRIKTHELAKLFEGYSASDIKDVCQSAQLKAVHELFDSTAYQEPVQGKELPQPKNLTMLDFRQIKTQRKPSVSTEMIRAYYKWSEDFKAL